MQGPKGVVGRPGRWGGPTGLVLAVLELLRGSWACLVPRSPSGLRHVLSPSSPGATLQLLAYRAVVSGGLFSFF